ncbi:MAG: putative molybdenum carrier protein [Bacteroidales bacterium]
MRSPNNLTIISGGQSGVDRAALDYALSNHFQVGGWCPLGRHAEDGTINIRYPLSDTFSADLLNRTQFNILESDGTLIVVFDEMDEGTQVTFDLARENKKPVFVWKIEHNRNYQQFRNWLEKNGVHVLNVAGPRESNAVGIYEATLDLMSELLGTYD